MKLVSREYKVMLDHEPFVDRGQALRAIQNDLGALVGKGGTIAERGAFDQEEQRSITFFDTPPLALRHVGFVLRRRFAGKRAEYTLKCRSEDRYFAAGADLHAVSGVKPDEKLEEDIAPPFRCRFSHSNTARPSKKSGLGQGVPPASLDEVAAVFPILGALCPDGRPVPVNTPLSIVNGITVFERVYSGTRLLFNASEPEGGTKEASVALILWTDGEQGPPLVAELSFRLKDKKERFSRALSRSSRSCFEALQRLDRVRPQGTSKTEFIYRDRLGE